MAEFTKQHWVPRSYLEAWIDPKMAKERFVWVFNKDGTGKRPSKPENLFHKRNLYTMCGEDGKRDLTVEKMLATIEGSFPAIRSKLVEGKPLTLREHSELCLFVAAMRSRSIQSTSGAQAAFRHVKDQIDEQFSALVRQFSPEGYEAGIATARDDPQYKELSGMAENVAPQWVAESLRHAKILVQMRFEVLQESGEGPGFITSDAPCVLVDPEHHKLRPFFRATAPSLGAREARLTLPICPRACLLFSWGLPADWAGLDSEAVAPTNRITCAHSEQWVVTCSDTFLPQWMRGPVKGDAQQPPASHQE